MSGGRPFRRRVLVNTLATFAGNGWSIVVSLVTVPLLLRGLGPIGFGLWALLQIFSAVSGWISVLPSGLGTVATRMIADAAARDDRRSTGAVMGTMIALVGCGGVVVGTLLALVGSRALPVIFAAGGASDALRVAVVFYSGQVVAEAIIESVESCLEGLQRVDLSRALDAGRRTLVAVAVVSAALSGRGLVTVAAAACAATVVSTFVSLGVLAWITEVRALRPSLVIAARLSRGAAPVMLLRPLGVLERTMDRLIVGVAFGPAGAAVVEIATQIANGAAAVLSASAYAVVPAAAWLRGRGDRFKLRELLDQGTRYSMLVTLPMVLGVSILIVPGMRLWVGSGHDEAVLPAVLALAAIAQVSPLQVGSELLLATGRTKDIVLAAACALAVNLSVSIALVRIVGIPGTFIGTLVAGFVLLPLLARAFLREVGESVREFARGVILPVVRPLALLAFATGLLVAFHGPDVTTVVIAAIIGAIAYLGGVARFALLPGELGDLRRLVTNR